MLNAFIGAFYGTVSISLPKNVKVDKYCHAGNIKAGKKIPAFQ
jgi:hypothetical protein